LTTETDLEESVKSSTFILSSNFKPCCEIGEPALLPIAILAGGLGTRLRPITERIPKAMVEIRGTPFIDHQLTLLGAAGITRAVLCVGFLGEMIEQHVGDGRRFGMAITYSYDGPQLIGTAGALKKAAPLLGERFFVTYGDSYLRCDYRAVEAEAIRTSAPGLMTVFRNEGAIIPSNVRFADGRVIAYDKEAPHPSMRHVDYGLCVFSASSFDEVEADGQTDLSVVFQSLISGGRLAGFEVTEPFFEVGTQSGIAELERRLRVTDASA
jgi:NDP-sugar pyrophosphorylase family protein